jgi:hypothetical protein
MILEYTSKRLQNFSIFDNLFQGSGEMAEWSNAAVSKTVVRLPANRGFESPSLRKGITAGKLQKLIAENTCI